MMVHVQWKNVGYNRVDEIVQLQFLITTEPNLPDCSSSTKAFLCVIETQLW